MVGFTSSQWPGVGVHKSNSLEARMIVTTFNLHVRFLSPGPWLVGTSQVYPGAGADIVMESIALIWPCAGHLSVIGTSPRACASTRANSCSSSSSVQPSRSFIGLVIFLSPKRWRKSCRDRPVSGLKGKRRGLTSSPRVPKRYGDCYFCKASLTNASRLRISLTISETAIAQDSHWWVSLRSSARERIIWSLLRI